MTYHPTTIDQTGTAKWIDNNTKMGYQEFMHLVELGVKPAAIARACKKDSRTVTGWLNRIAHDKGYDDWHGLYTQQ